MNPYELILLFDPGAAEEKIGQFVTKLEDKIRGAGERWIRPKSGGSRSWPR